MLPLDEALARILDATAPLAAQSVGLEGALGRVLAEPVLATRDLPPEDNSAMDGYAVRAEDLAAVPVELEVVGTVAAGDHATRTMGPGEAMRIFTGAPVPPGADTVIMQEVATVAGTKVTLREGGPRGHNVRPRGDDVRAGDEVVAAGTPVGPAEIAAVASQGRTRLRVVRPPQVAVLGTGDELVEPDGDVAGGRIVSSNNLGVAAACAEAGARCIDLGIARDDPKAIAERLEGARGADVLVTTGGVSVGEHDHVKAVLEGRGLTTVFWKVAIKPGKPLLFGTLPGQLVFGLPGNPVSALTTFEVFVRPALCKLAGHPPARPRVRARLLAEAPGTRRRANVLWLRLEAGPDGLTATPRARQASHRLQGPIAAHGYVVVPPDATLDAGAEVEVHLVRPPGG